MDPSKAVPALIGAVVGGVIGALIWGGIAYATKYEIGYVAWGIGLLVGAGAGMLGGRGTMMGGICAVIAVLSIFGGKLFAFQMFISDSEDESYAEYAEEEANIYLTRESYQAVLAEAAELASVSTDEQRRAFMIKYEYTPATQPGDVSQETVDWFKEAIEPNLRDIHAKQAPYEQWREESTARIAEGIREQVETDGYSIGAGDYFSALKESLGLMDIVFMLLGTVTAFKIGCGRER